MESNRSRFGLAVRLWARYLTSLNLSITICTLVHDHLDHILDIYTYICLSNLYVCIYIKYKSSRKLPPCTHYSKISVYQFTYCKKEVLYRCIHGAYIQWKKQTNRHSQHSVMCFKWRWPWHYSNTQLLEEILSIIQVSI